MLETERSQWVQNLGSDSTKLGFMREAKFLFASLTNFWILHYSTCVGWLPTLHKLKFLDPLQPLQSETENRNHFLERSQNRRRQKCPIQSPQPRKKALPIQTLVQSTCHHWRNQALQKWAFDHRRGRRKSSKCTMVREKHSKFAFCCCCCCCCLMIVASFSSRHITVTLT